jgi:hypothetical protein
MDWYQSDTEQRSRTMTVSEELILVLAEGLTVLQQGSMGRERLGMFLDLRINRPPKTLRLELPWP